MAKMSSQHKLDKVRKPRVHITYDVHIGDAIEKVELPFIVGVMGDFSGDPTEKLPALRERRFTEINRDTFDDVMKKVNAGLNFRVDNTMLNDGSEMSVQLQFQSMDDFSPDRVARQVPELRALLEKRDAMKELIAKVDRSEDLGGLLEQVLQNQDSLKKLTEELQARSTTGPTAE